MRAACHNANLKAWLQLGGDPDDVERGAAKAGLRELGHAILLFMNRRAAFMQNSVLIQESDVRGLPGREWSASESVSAGCLPASMLRVAVFSQIGTAA